MIKLSKTAPEEYSGDLLVFFVSRPKKGAPKTNHGPTDAMVKRAHQAGDFSGKDEELLLFYPEPDKKQGHKAKRVLVVGLGDKKPDREMFRLAGGRVAAQAAKTKSKKVMAVLPEGLEFSASEMAECLVEGILLGIYSFKKYKTKKKDEDREARIDELSLYAPAVKGLRAAVKNSEIAARAACAARDMANEPGNLWTPSHFAEFGKSLAKQYSLKCTVLSAEQMKKLGMGGILGVNQGSAQPPKMIILEYRTSAKAPTILLVGKGLTFDSGGISLKPSAGMEEMKYDMCGGAAVLCTMQAVAEARVAGVNVVAIVPSTENLPGPSAIKPGDIVTHYNGKTVEVVNTDAEGRLILADALAYGIKKFKPKMVVDVATLTGAVIIGLGHHRTGLLANDDDLCNRLIAAGEESGEPLWRLPLGPEYTKQLKSEIADLKNVGKRDGGTITAASFLQEFVGDTPWAHLDIAGTAWNFTEKSYVPKGPSGIAVRTLFSLVRNLKK